MNINIRSIILEYQLFELISLSIIYYILKQTIYPATYCMMILSHHVIIYHSSFISPTLALVFSTSIATLHPFLAFYPIVDVKSQLKQMSVQSLEHTNFIYINNWLSHVYFESRKNDLSNLGTSVMVGRDKLDVFI